MVTLGESDWFFEWKHRREIQEPKGKPKISSLFVMALIPEVPKSFLLHLVFANS